MYLPKSEATQHLEWKNRRRVLPNREDLLSQSCIWEQRVRKGVAASAAESEVTVVIDRVMLHSDALYTPTSKMN